MYLSELRIKNFRRLGDAEIRFQPGLNVIVGENNSGKTAVVDAILTVLNRRTADIDDLRVEGDKRAEGFTIEAFCDELGLADEAAFVEALIPAAEKGKYRVRITVAASARGEELDRNVDVGSGGKSGAYYEVLKRQRLDYLPALRDPQGTTGLRPGRQSRLAQLLRRTATDPEQGELCDIALEANKNMKATGAVGRAKSIVSNNLDLISGVAYALETDLNFVSPDFDRLAAQLEGYADGLPVGLTGLGYGNLVYIAAVLGDLEEGNDSDKRYRALVIEEPEAHLHPQHQILLLRFLEKQVEESDKSIQIFVTTHSPILASQAALNNLLPVFDIVVGEGQKTVRKTVAKPVSIDPATDNAVRIKQYLDATRSELFFAKRLILVEGDAEKLLLPALAKAWNGQDLEKNGVTIVSAAGLNFGVFLPFIGKEVLNIPVAIITDADPPRTTIGGEELSESEYVNKLRSMTANEPNITVCVGTKTLEYDLAMPDANAPVIIDAIERVRRNKGKDFRETIGQERGAEFAKRFYEEFFSTRGTSKAEFAMELSLGLGKAREFVVPAYIVAAFEHVLPAATPGEAPA